MDQWREAATGFNGSPPLSEVMLRRRSPWKFRVATLVLPVVAMLVGMALAEFLVRWILPQPSLYPRNAFSEEYGFLSPRNTTIVHEMPGRWRFEYTTNRLGHRGEEIALSNRYDKPNVVILGDSYTFGQGVNDGEEYPAILAKALRGRADVVNLATSGWGLTQEIRRYYELGGLFQPRIVVLQFCANDLADNLLTEVTRISEGRFLFVPNPNRLHSFKRHLSDSWLQKSQLYNLARSAFYDRYRVREVADAMANVGQGNEPSRAELLHAELLQPFARDLKSRGITLVMISVGQDLQRFPHIERTVRILQAEGSLRFLESIDSVYGKWPDVSAEDAHWGPLTQRLVGQRLAVELSSLLP